MHITDPIKFWLFLWVAGIILILFDVADCPKDWGCPEKETGGIGYVEHTHKVDSN